MTDHDDHMRDPTMQIFCSTERVVILRNPRAAEQRGGVVWRYVSPAMHPGEHWYRRTA